MKNKTRKIVIILFILLVSILMFFSLSPMATYNSSSVGNETNDQNKTAATLNDRYVHSSYEARDMATYNNLYCVKHSGLFDNKLIDKTNIRLVATAAVDIIGNNATFYKVDDSDDRKLKQVGSTNATENNVIAGILTARPTTKYNGYTVYKGYGGLTEPRS